MNESNMGVFCKLKNLDKMTDERKLFYILLSYTQEVSEEIPQLYCKEEISDTESKEVYAYPFIAFFKNSDLNEVGDVHILMQVNTYVDDGEAKDVSTPTSTEYYTLLTKIERSYYNNINAKLRLNESLDENERGFYDSIKYPISEYYSDILEEYLMNGNKKASLDSFLDVLVPVIEVECFTLVKYDVKRYIEKHNDWYLDLIKNDHMLSIFEDTSHVQHKIPNYLVDDLENALNNYFRISYRTFAVLSAATRGSNISTSELYRSCSTFYKKDPSKLFDDRRFFVTLIQPNVPTYPQDFIETVLMGNVPMFIQYAKDMDVSALELDLFYHLKSTIIANCEKLRAELCKVFSDNSEVMEILEFDKTAITKKTLYHMYPRYKNKIPESELLNGSYKCVFVDYIVYSRTLMHYMHELDAKKWSLVDFFNLISPVQLDKDYITKYQED